MKFRRVKKVKAKKGFAGFGPKYLWCFRLDEDQEKAFICFWSGVYGEVTESLAHDWITLAAGQNCIFDVPWIKFLRGRKWPAIGL